jgi:hypothetical protein
MGQWLIQPNADPIKAARGAKVVRTPSRIALGEAYLTYADDWRWLQDVLSALPTRHGRLGLWLPDGKVNPRRPVPGPQPWRLSRNGRFWHGRPGARGEGHRTRWFREPWAATDRGLWMLQHRPGHQSQNVAARVPEALVSWVTLLRENPLEVLGKAGRKTCECAVCGRPLGPNSNERGIGPECLSLLGPLLTPVSQ